ncbi:DHA2 family efflux MFS transporter permease subunit [Antrihabitans cavernicola]|uniref:DHA2 family efflux MFS transporter permease subunit n=1 Tax=Antrihabitans cavernicola TaxID=2495913 RepID=UPI001BE450C1|nr:DHA2 family efflux MFS transporter permease subunit [Spelaeibacter cavernicola]
MTAIREDTTIPPVVWRMAWVIAFGAFAGGLDASVTNIGLDSIGADLHANLATTQWVSSGYLLALAVSLPACAWLGRRIGVGRLWLCALAGFTIASALCALAPNIESLVALRVVQGLAAGLLVPAGQTILGQAVGPERLGRLMATLGIAVSLAPALGPVAGGVILHWSSWHWLFLVNVPIGIAELALGMRLIPRGAARPTERLEWRGLILIGVGLPLLVFALTSWGSAGTPLDAEVWISLTLGVAGLAAFTARSLRQHNPLLDMRLYSNRVYVAASATAGFSGALMFGSALLFPLYFQLLHGSSVISTGLQLLSLGGGTALALPLCGRLIDRFGGGTIATLGGIATVATTLPFVLLDANSDPILVQILLVLLGIAIACAAVPPGIEAFKTVQPDQLPDATAQVSIVQRIGGAVGGALFAVVLARGLSTDAESAFRSAFTWQLIAAAATTVSAAWLWFSCISSPSKSTARPSAIRKDQSSSAFPRA